MERDLFLRKYRIEQEDFDAAGVSWEELTAIADHYATIEGKLREIGKDFVDKYLYDIEKAGIHSYRYRTKAPGHLLEKIIRKKKEQPEKFAQLGVDNYWKYVTDLIGIRVFFLYREDWRHFHEYITSAFENAPEQYVKDRERDFDNDETHCYIAERPKVYRRNGDSRIYEAVDAAGGFTENAARESINLASKVSDGMQITIYNKEEAASLPAGGTSAGKNSGQDQMSGSSSLVNLNTATKEELMTLKGIGESKAEDIIRYREKSGGFKKIEDIMKISGIKEAGFQKIKDSITV